MHVPAREQQGIRFGPFTVDLLSRELWKGNQKVPLQEKPFQLLVILLDNPGKLVTREELRQKLWPADTFVDFDHSINTAINKIRETLGDSSDSPRFLETLPRRGYRFIAPVEDIPSERSHLSLVAQRPSSPSRQQEQSFSPLTMGECIPGVLLGHYQVLEKIGTGGIGEVFRARDQHLDREVAIKVLRPGTLADEHTRKHFHKEALALSRLNHSNIATIHDFDSQQGLDFIVMEYIRGVSLTAKVAKGALPEDEILSLGAQLAEGLAAAHECGVVHRDLKPGNLLLTTDGRLKILDFGMAKLRLPLTDSAETESVTQTREIYGTPPYMAPEQLVGGEMDARTDIHAAGAVLYEMATGLLPFGKAESSKLVAAILHSAPQSPAALNPRISPELGNIIRKCLEKEPENRYQSAKELAIDLHRLLREKHSLNLSSHQQPSDRHTSVLRWTLVASIVSVLVVSAVIFTVVWYRNSRIHRPADTSLPSIAVLPFADLSPGHDHEYFSDGLAEEILNNLTKIPNLKVAARTSAFQFRGANKDTQAIGLKLNVTNLLEGSVQTADGRVRITVHLTKADLGLSLWSETYDRELKDIFAVEDDIAAAVSAALQPKLLGHTTSQARAPSRTTSPDAYQAFLQARYFDRRSDAESERRAFAFVNRAIQLDASYAPAYAQRAIMTAEAAGMGRLDLSAAMQDSRRDAERAIALDPNLAAAYLALSETQAMAQWDWQGAERSVERARELAPGDADVLGQSGFLAMCRGHLQEATALMSQGIALDPLQPVRYLYLAQALRDFGRYDAAHAALEKSLELSPTLVWAHETRGELHLAQGRFQDALTEMEKEPNGPFRDFGEALAYHALGRYKDSETALARLIAADQNDAAWQIAQVYTYRGEPDQAFAWLDRSCRQHDFGVGHLQADWIMKNLRSDPRYQQFRIRLNLTD